MSGAMIVRPRSLAGLAAAALVAAGALLAGCDDDVAKPVPLEPLEAKISGHEVWKLSLGGAGFTAFGLVNGSAAFGAQGIAVAGTNFIIGAANGALLSVDADTGKENWRADAGGRLTTGVGSDGRLAGSLILVGRGAVGKTSLIEVLKGGKFIEGAKKTEGIAITHWPLMLQDTSRPLLRVNEGGCSSCCQYRLGLNSSLAAPGCEFRAWKHF